MFTDFKDMLIQVIGTYTPDLTCADWGQIDWVWIAGFLLFLHVVIIFFKIFKEIFKEVFKF